MHSYGVELAVVLVVVEVLILVLMEDALVRMNVSLREGDERLNPCFNGRCTRT